MLLAFGVRVLSKPDGYNSVQMFSPTLEIQVSKSTCSSARAKTLNRSKQMSGMCSSTPEGFSYATCCHHRCCCWGGIWVLPAGGEQAGRRVTQACGAELAMYQ